ncbi:hypothetical protein LOTGIDRAFT_147416, partial [Lottia gigantea]
VNTHRSAISQTLQILSKDVLKDQSLVRRFMKGFYDRKPPRPKYLVTWDVSVLVSYLSTLHPLENLSLKLVVTLYWSEMSNTNCI